MNIISCSCACWKVYKQLYLVAIHHKTYTAIYFVWNEIQWLILCVLLLWMIHIHCAIYKWSYKIVCFVCVVRVSPSFPMAAILYSCSESDVFQSPSVFMEHTSVCSAYSTKNDTLVCPPNTVNVLAQCEHITHVPSTYLMCYFWYSVWTRVNVFSEHIWVWV